MAIPPGSAGPAGHAPRSELAPPAHPHPQQDRKRAPDAGDLAEGAGNAAIASTLGPSRADLVRSVLDSPGQRVGADVVELVRDTTGQDASDIVVHDGPEAEAAADSVDAKMFASGRHIVAPRGLDVTTREGVFGTVHEVHHILNQQAKGPVEGTDTGDGLSISDPGDRFEQEADAVATIAVQQRFS